MVAVSEGKVDAVVAVAVAVEEAVVVVIVGKVTDIKMHNPYVVVRGNNGSFVPENKVYSRDEY